MLKGFWREWKGVSLWYKLKQLRWELRYAFRRAWEGHDDIDVINFQYRFAERMINILKDYREYTCSYGGIFETMNDKYKTIDEMILAFQEMKKDEDDELEKKYGENYHKRKTFLEDYEQATKICDDRKDKAFDLLKEYFYYL